MADPTQRPDSPIAEEPAAAPVDSADVVDVDVEPIEPVETTDAPVEGSSHRRPPVTIDVEPARPDAAATDEAALADVPAADQAPAEAMAGDPPPPPELPPPEVPQPAPPPSGERGGTGVFGVVVAALAGAVLALAGLVGLQSAGIWPRTTDTTRLAELLRQADARLAEVGSRPQLSPEAAALLGALPERLAALEKAATPPAEPVQSGAPSEEVVRRLNELVKEAEDRKAEIASLRDELAKPPMPDPRLDELGTRLAAVEKRVADMAAVEPPTPVDQAARDRLDKLEPAMADLAKKTETMVADGLRSAEAAVRTTADELRARLDKVEASLAEATQGLQAMIRTQGDEVRAGIADAARGIAAAEADRKALAARLGEVATQNAARLQPEVERLTASINSVETRLAAAEPAARAATEARDQATLVLALSALRSAVASGGPFATEVTAIAALSPDLDVAPLKAVAAKGVLSEQTLIARFKDVADKAQETAATAEAGDGVMDRLMANARSLVRVRPVGEVPGDGVPERLARIEARLALRDLPGALREWRGLPETAQAAGGDWGAQLAARVAVDSATQKLTQTILERLAAAKR